MLQKLSVTMQREIIIEIIEKKTFLKIVAMDVETKKEVFLMMPLSSKRHEIEFLAREKIAYVLNKEKDAKTNKPVPKDPKSIYC